MIKIIAVGKISQKYLNQGIGQYLKQIPSKIEIIEIKDEPSIKGISIEGDKILSKVRENDYLISLVIQSKMIDSYEFSKMIDDIYTYHQGDLAFVIGGSHGLSEAVIKRSNKKISFSKMTFPHQLMRLILIEQIYRGFMILKNHPYHK